MILLEMMFDNALFALNFGEIRDLNLVDQTSFHEFWINNVPFHKRSQISCFDIFEMFLILFNLGF